MELDGKLLSVQSCVSGRAGKPVVITDRIYTSSPIKTSHHIWIRSATAGDEAVAGSRTFGHCSTTDAASASRDFSLSKPNHHRSDRTRTPNFKNSRPNKDARKNVFFRTSQTWSGLMPSWTNLRRFLLSFGSKLSSLVFEAPLGNRKL